MSSKQQLPQQDIYERVNFLYQAAHVVMEGSSDKAQVAQFYGKTMHSIARRGVLKLDPSIKRSLCKGCHTLLVPGVTASLRLRAKRETHYALTCLNCKAMKRFLCRPGHSLWCDNPDALVQAPAPKKLPPPAAKKVLPYQICANTETLTFELPLSEHSESKDAMKMEVNADHLKPETVDDVMAEG